MGPADHQAPPRTPRTVQRADRLLDDGDLKGNVVWRRIGAAIEELW
jgi:hypothetical protein